MIGIRGMLGCKLRFGLAAVFAVMVSTAAAAGEAGLPSAAPYKWAGFYFGIDGAYGAGDRSVDWSGNAATEATYLSSGGVARSVVTRPEGFLGGLHLGYDRQFGRFVAGIETDFAFANIHDIATATGGTMTIVDPSNLPLYTASNHPQFVSSAGQALHALGTLRGRLGVLATDQLLIYGTGGVAYGHASMSAAVNNTGTYTEFFTASDNVLFFTQQYPACRDICASSSASRWLVGGTVGAGLEYALFDRWTARFEYLYYNLGKMSVTVADPRFPAQAFTASALFAGQVARVGLTYRFD